MISAVNAITQDLPQLVPDPYTFLSGLWPNQGWLTVLDLKDTFFCIPLHEDSIPIFAFTWKDRSDMPVSLSWHRLPEGYKNSPILFSQALAQDLRDWPRPKEALLLQYMDDFLLVTEFRNQCKTLTVDLLNLLANQGFRSSKTKAQMVQVKVRLWGHDLTRGKRDLAPERIDALLRIPTPKTPAELCSFLGLVGFCRLWIWDFGS